MRAEWKRFGIAAVVIYAVAFLLLYALGCCAATLPAVSPVSLSLAFDTVPERLRFAAHVSFWMLIITVPFLFLWSRSKHNREDSPNKPSHHAVDSHTDASANDW